jgi:hypothetical protein
MKQMSASIHRARPSAVQRQGLPPRTRSYVPDHVRNPQRYTCYTLDEPILVGGGDQDSAAADGGQADMLRVRGYSMSSPLNPCLRLHIKYCFWLR